MALHSSSSAPTITIVVVIGGDLSRVAWKSVLTGLNKYLRFTGCIHRRAVKGIWEIIIILLRHGSREKYSERGCNGMTMTMLRWRIQTHTQNRKGMRNADPKAPFVVCEFHSLRRRRWGRRRPSCSLARTSSILCAVVVSLLIKREIS